MNRNHQIRLQEYQSTPIIFKSANKIETIDINCMICLSKCKNPCVCPNMHAFCSGCFTTWLEQHKNCPTCRVPVNKVNLIVGADDEIDEDSLSDDTDEDADPDADDSNIGTEKNSNGLVKRKAKWDRTFQYYENEITRRKKYKALLRTVNSNLRKLEEKNHGLNKNLSDKNKIVEHLKSKLTEASDQKRKFQEQIDNLENSLESSKNREKKQLEKIYVKDIELKSAQETNAQEINKLKNSLTEFQALEKKNQELNKNLSDKNKIVEHLKSKLTEATDQKRKFQEQIDNLENSLESSNTRANELIKENSELKIMQEKKSSELITMKKIIKELHLLEEKNHDLNETLTDKENQIVNLNNKITEVTDQLLKLRDKITNFEKYLDLSKNRERKLITENTELKSIREKNASELYTLKTTIKDLQTSESQLLIVNSKLDTCLSLVEMKNKQLNQLKVDKLELQKLLDKETHQKNEHHNKIRQRVESMVESIFDSPPDTSEAHKTTQRTPIVCLLKRSQTSEIRSQIESLSKTRKIASKAKTTKPKRKSKRVNTKLEFVVNPRNEALSKKDEDYSTSGYVELSSD